MEDIAYRINSGLYLVYYITKTNRLYKVYYMESITYTVYMGATTFEGFIHSKFIKEIHDVYRYDIL